MSSKNKPEKTEHNIMSAVTFLAGLLLTWLGYRESLSLWEQIDNFFSVSPETYSTFILIAGIACLVAGFTGLLRGKII
jgi:hypothetical protein